LNLKTGAKIDQLNFEKNPDLNYICCDEKQINYVKNLANIFNLSNVEINAYCSFTPGGKFYTLQGQSHFDTDNNGCNAQDPVVPHIKFSIKQGNNTTGEEISDGTSYYAIPFQAGTYTISPYVKNPLAFTIIPASLTIIFPSTSDTTIQDFCIKPIGVQSKLDLTILPLSPPARPGFETKYKIIVENNGNQTESGTLNFNYNDHILNYVRADISPSEAGFGNLNWNYSNLKPFEKLSFIVTMKVNKPTDAPPVNAGDILRLSAHAGIFATTTDIIVVGSYDPNDKTCLQGQYFHPDSVGKYVDFLIRFENTGNFAAENVVIKDIIDDKTFDVSSLLITDASHEVYTRIVANKVEFIFENIQLPFEDETNDGYVAFKIKTKSTLKLGDEMKNLADIYFDYNFPIRTNETQTTIAIPSGTRDIQTEVTIHPNPVRDVLTLDSSNRWTKAEIFDISGRLIKVSGVDGFSVDVSGLESGTYILHLSDKDKRGRVKFMKM
jgi:uncharacterized repeat protein (TIGR01451 family)